MITLKTLERIVSKIKILPLLGLLACGHVSANRTIAYDSYHTAYEPEDGQSSGNHSIGVRESISVKGDNYGTFMPSIAVEVDERRDDTTGVVIENNPPLLIAYQSRIRTNRVRFLTELGYNLFNACDNETAIGSVCVEWNIGVGVEVDVTVRRFWYDFGVDMNPLFTATIYDLEPPPSLTFDHDFYISHFNHTDIGPITGFYEIRVGLNEISTLFGGGIVWGRNNHQEE